MFADLCRTSSVEDQVFLLCWLGIGVVLAVISVGITRHIHGKFRSSMRYAWPAMTGLVGGLAAWKITEVLWPDPRVTGTDCGMTPDAILLPLGASLAVVVGFAVGLAFVTFASLIVRRRP